MIENVHRIVLDDEIADIVGISNDIECVRNLDRRIGNEKIVDVWGARVAHV